MPSRFVLVARRFAVTFALLVVCAACGDLKALASFTMALQSEYKQSVNVNVSNGTHLKLTFQNVPDSVFTDSTSRADYAMKVAQFAKANYAKSAELEDISVAFESVNAAGPVKVTRTNTPYVFAMRDIK